METDFLILNKGNKNKTIFILILINSVLIIALFLLFFFFTFFPIRPKYYTSPDAPKAIGPYTQGK
jgi:flagellar basal body-associated protein FliL